MTGLFYFTVSQRTCKIIHSRGDFFFFARKTYYEKNLSGWLTSSCIQQRSGTHSFQYAPSKNVFLAFNQEVISRFTIGYDNQHDRTWPVFQKPFGYAPKIVGKTEKSQLIDYIISHYEILDKRCLDEFFGSFFKAMIAMEEGVCLNRVNFEQIAPDETVRLANAMMARSRATKRRIQKFLHLYPGDKTLIIKLFVNLSW